MAFAGLKCQPHVSLYAAYWSKAVVGWHWIQIAIATSILEATHGYSEFHARLNGLEVYTSLPSHLVWLRTPIHRSRLMAAISSERLKRNKMTMDFSCSHVTLGDRKMRSAALIGQSWLMPFFECWMWRKRTLTDDRVIQNPNHDFEPMPCVHAFPLFELVWRFMMRLAQNERQRYRQSDLITRSKEFAFQSDFHIVFLGWVQYLKVQWGLGGLEPLMHWDVFCFRHQGMFCTPAKCKSSPCSQDSFAPASAVFHANLGRKPYIDLVIVAPEMFELLAVNFQTQNTSFFFQLFWEFNLGFLWARRIWWQWWGVARAVPSPWAQQFHLRGQWNGGLISTDKLKIIDPLMVLCQVNCCILNWIYLHILITHCTMTITISCLYEGTLIVWINVYTARIYSQYSTFLSDFTLYTTKITNFEHFSTFKHHLKKVFLRFLKSQEMCSQFGWDTADGISREQFEDLVGDWWVGRVVVSSFCRQILQYFSIQVMKLLNILEWKGPCSA